MKRLFSIALVAAMFFLSVTEAAAEPPPQPPTVKAPSSAHPQLRESAKQAEPCRQALLKLLNDDEQRLWVRIVALALVQTDWNDEVAQSFIKLLTHPNRHLRQMAADGLAHHTKKGDQKVHQELVSVLNERDPAVLRSFALAIGTIGAEGAADSLISLLEQDDSKDPFLREGITRAIERLGKPGIDALLNLSNSGQDSDLQLVVETFRSLRTRSAAEALPVLLKHYHLNDEQRVKLLQSYRNYPPGTGISSAPVVDLLDKLAARTTNITNTKELNEAESLRPVKLAAVEALAFAGNAPSDKVSQLLVTILEKERFVDTRIAAIRTAGELHVSKAGPVLAKMLVEGSLRSEQERQALVAALGKLKNKEAGTILLNALQNENLAATEEGRMKWADALQALRLIDPAMARQLSNAGVLNTKE